MGWRDRWSGRAPNGKLMSGEPSNSSVSTRVSLVYFCRTLVQEIGLSAERSTAVERSALTPNCKGCPDNEL